MADLLRDWYRHVMNILFGKGWQDNEWRTDNENLQHPVQN